MFLDDSQAKYPSQQNNEELDGDISKFLERFQESEYFDASDEEIWLSMIAEDETDEDSDNDSDGEHDYYDGMSDFDDNDETDPVQDNDEEFFTEAEMDCSKWTDCGKSYLKADKIIITVAALLHLLKICQTPNCGKLVGRMKVKHAGSSLKVTGPLLFTSAPLLGAPGSS